MDTDRVDEPDTEALERVARNTVDFDMENVSAGVKDPACIEGSPRDTAVIA